MLFAETEETAEAREKLQLNVNEYQKKLNAINMEINVNKSKTMIIANEIKERKIKIKGQLLEQVRSYRYLGIYWFDCVDVQKIVHFTKSVVIGGHPIYEDLI